MGQKISPTSFRTGINKDWLSHWFNHRKYKSFLKEDLAVRNFLDKRLRGMSVDRVEIEKGSDLMNIIIYSARPGW